MLSHPTHPAGMGISQGINQDKVSRGTMGPVTPGAANMPQGIKLKGFELDNVRSKLVN